MNKFPKWDTERYRYTSDYILQLFAANYEPPEVYRAVSKHFVLKNEAERQSLANEIAALWTCNVFATMPVPQAPEVA
jgi:hypothetical protein